MICFESLFVFAVLLFSVVFFFIQYFYSYWKNKGVPHDPPTFPYGNGKGIGKKVNFAEIVEKSYLKFKSVSPFYGIYLLIKPIAVITDLNLIKTILVRDFNYFNTRGVFHNEKDDPLSGNMVAVDGAQWRFLRTKLTPTFTSGKMKFMFPTIVKVGHELEATLSEMIEKNSIVEIKGMLSRFTTDVIGTCAFGIECNSLKDPNAEFRVRSKDIFTRQGNHAVIESIIQNYPNIGRMFSMKTFPDDINEFFINVVRRTIQFREKSDFRRNDFMDLLIDIKRKDNNGNSLSIEEIAAQAFVFFFAGFETSSTVMNFCLYELAQNQNIQDKIRYELNEVLQKHNNEFTYEVMKDMTYLEQAINETLRKYPPVPVLFRASIADYAVPGTKLVIEKNTRIFIPVRAIHHDPEYYPNPEFFDPDRFSLENSKNRQSCTFLPFGDGPRSCIGVRFGKMQTFIGLILLLKKFRFSTCEATKIPPEFEKKGFIISPLGGISLKVEKV